MKRGLQAMIAGTALTAALWTGAASASEPFSTLRASADEQFSTLANIQAETISQNQLATVEGKLILDLSKVLGSEAVVKLLEPGQLLSVKLLSISLGGTPSSSVGVLGLNVLGLSL